MKDCCSASLLDLSKPKRLNALPRRSCPEAKTFLTSLSCFNHLVKFLSVYYSLIHQNCLNDSLGHMETTRGSDVGLHMPRPWRRQPKRDFLWQIPTSITPSCTASGWLPPTPRNSRTSVFAWSLRYFEAFADSEVSAVRSKLGSTRCIWLRANRAWLDFIEILTD